MATYNPSQLGSLLQQWGSGNLNNIVHSGHAVLGVPDAVMTSSGLTAVGLCQRFTLEEVDQALEKMLEGEFRLLALILICRHLLGWTVERISRALDHASTSITHSLLMIAEDVFAGVML